MMNNIVIKSDPRVDHAKRLGPGFHGSTRKNLKYIFKVLIFHIKKLRNNPCEYRL